MVEVKDLGNGWVQVRFSSQCWAQFPKGFDAESLPDDFIFQPEWNRTTVNDWWRSMRDARN